MGILNGLDVTSIIQSAAFYKKGITDSLLDFIFQLFQRSGIGLLCFLHVHGDWIIVLPVIDSTPKHDKTCTAIQGTKG